MVSGTGSNKSWWIMISLRMDDHPGWLWSARTTDGSGWQQNRIGSYKTVVVCGGYMMT